MPAGRDWNRVGLGQQVPDPAWLWGAVEVKGATEAGYRDGRQGL